MLAGFGMILGLIQYSLGKKYMGDAGMNPIPPETPEARARQTKMIWAGLAIFAVLIGVPVLLQAAGVIEITAQMVGNATGIVLAAVSIGVFAWLLSSKEWSAVERKRLIAVGALFIACALFFAAYEQAGSTLTLLADRSTNNHAFGWAFPSSWYQSLSAVFVVALAPVFAIPVDQTGQARTGHSGEIHAGVVVGGIGIRRGGNRSMARAVGSAHQPDVAGGDLLHTRVR